MKVKLTINNLSYELREVVIEDVVPLVERRIHWYTARGWSLTGTRAHESDQDYIVLRFERHKVDTEATR